MHLPLIDNLTILQIHTVQGVRVTLILENHVRILRMQHNLLGAEQLATWRLDLGDVGRELQVVVGCMLEDTNLGATDDK